MMGMSIFNGGDHDDDAGDEYDHDDDDDDDDMENDEDVHFHWAITLLPSLPPPFANGV